MGLLRVILALSVITGHADTTLFGLLWVDKFYAVQAFFAISGFYMALVLNGRYASLPVSAFYRSRALRIYPGYYIGLALTVLVNRGEIKATLHDMAPLTRLYTLVQNGVIFGQDLSYVLCMRDTAGGCIPAMNTTIDPPAWSLAVELAFYVAAPFVVRHPARIGAMMAAGTAYLVATNAVAFPVAPAAGLNIWSDFALRYYFYPSSYVFFGMGALAYHLDRRGRCPPYGLVLGGVAAFALVNTVMPPWHLVVLALAIPQLFRLTRDDPRDRALGEFSYPLYILHWPVLIFVQRHRGALAPVLAHASVGTVVVVVTACAAAAVFFAVDRPMDRIRRPAPGGRPAEAREPAWIRVWFVACLVPPAAVLAAALL